MDRPLGVPGLTRAGAAPTFASMRAIPRKIETGTIVAAPFGALGVACDDEAVAEITYLPPGTAEIAPRGALAERAARQLRRYLEDADFRFDLPLARAAGTPFQRAVWREIAHVPRGRVVRYGDIAKRLHSAPRAVGQACGANPFPLVIPCHRVVSAQGLGGFANHRDGFLIATKRWLLAHEGCPTDQLV